MSPEKRSSLNKKRIFNHRVNILKGVCGWMDIDPIERIDLVDLLGYVVRVMDRKLTPREAKILKMRYALESPKSYTYREIGEDFKVCSQRVRQIEARAIRKLKKALPVSIAMRLYES